MGNAWLAQFVDEVAAHVSSWDGDIPLQCHVYRNVSEGNDEWEVTLFGEPQTFGGRLTSLSLDAAFNVDVLRIAAVFDDIEACHWQTAIINTSDELGPHFSVTGSHQGRHVWLRILGSAPERLRQSAQPVQSNFVE